MLTYSVNLEQMKNAIESCYPWNQSKPNAIPRSWNGVAHRLKVNETSQNYATQNLYNHHK